MNFSRPFIERPVATTIIMLAFVVFGWASYAKLAVSELPNIDFPTIVVTANLPGANPEDMANTVAMPLEKSLSLVAGIDAMSSVNTTGSTKITMQFTLSRDIDAAVQDVQAAISQSINKLPTELTTAPTLRKVNPTQAPVLYMVVTADHLPMSVLNDYAESYLSQSISMINGVAEVNVYGSQQYAVRIKLNPVALAARKLDLAAISKAIKNISSHLPSGLLSTKGHYNLMQADAQLTNAEQFNNAIIAVDNDGPIRLKDVAAAVDGVANDKVATWFNDDRAIVLAVQKQPGSNTVAIIDAVKKELPKLLKNIPGGVKVNIVNDRSIFIKNSIAEVQETLLFAIVLVLIITYLFFKNLNATLVTALDFPTSLVATFAVMYLFSYSLDNLSLMGLVLAVGFVIDDTIVVLENILRYLEQGLSKMQAALTATKEICFTVISMTLSLVAVFIPLLFMGGLIGRLFREFAVVVGVAILFSGFVSLTLTPMLRSRFLSVANESSNIVVDKFNQYFDWSKFWYMRTLNLAFDNAKFVWLAAGVIIALTVVLAANVAKGFIPTEDMDLITATTQVQEGVVFADFCAYQQQALQIVRKNSNVRSVISNVGQGQGALSATTNGQFTIQLKPFDQRKKNVEQIIAELRQQLKNIVGLQVFMQAPASIKIGSVAGGGSYQYILQGLNWQELRQAAQALQTALQGVPGVCDLNSDLQLRNPEVHVNILRDRAALLGVTPEQIQSAIYMAYGGYKVNTIIGAVDEYQVIIEIAEQYQQSIEQLGLLHLQATNGAMVPLTAVATFVETVGAISVNHYGQLPAVTLSFNLAPGASLGGVTARIEQIAQANLPANISFTPVGTAQTFKDCMKSLPLLFVFTVLVIYMVLAILYEHFIHPLTILTALPFAAFGALLSLFIFNQELNIYSFIGIVLLVGLVKKNGIIMVDFALAAKRGAQITAREAITKACDVRYRPIMMTTLAALFSVLPLALSSGAGSAARNSLGIAVFGGLLFSQILTLYVTPLFYLMIDNLTEQFLAWLRRINTTNNP